MIRYIEIFPFILQFYLYLMFCHWTEIIIHIFLKQFFMVGPDGNTFQINHWIRNLPYKVTTMCIIKHTRYFNKLIISLQSTLMLKSCIYTSILLKYTVCMKVSMSVCKYGYAFRRAFAVCSWNMPWGRGWAHEVWEHIFEVTQPKVKGHPEVNLI